MPNSGDVRCIDGDRYKWATQAELECSDCPVPPPPQEGDIPGLLEAILAKMTRLVEIKEDDAWDPISANQTPYTVLNLAIATNTIKQEVEFSVHARSMIVISDQTITLNLYDRLRNGQDFTIQKVSGTTDYYLKQLSLWSLPKSRAVDKIYISNTSGSTANIQVIIWG